MFFLSGSLVEETPCEDGENMQTPHRKALEIAHLSTVHSGEDLPPRANSAPCGNRTHDLLAVRRQCKQCKQLSHHVLFVQQHHLAVLIMYIYLSGVSASFTVLSLCSTASFILRHMIIYIFIRC